MDAERIAFLAHEGLSAFETLGDDDALLIAVDNLSSILKNVTDDPATVGVGPRVERLVRRKLGIGHSDALDLVNVEVAPVL